MARIISIETATKTCSVALSHGKELVALKEVTEERYSHAEQLAVFIKDVLAEAGWKTTDLDAVAVSKGPGSYTGLRIGVSTAKGLCYALNIPMIAVPTPASLALQAINQEQDESAIYCPMLDARRMEVYAALYNDQLEEIREIRADIVDAETYLEYLDDQPFYYFGDGADKCAEVLDAFPNARLLPEMKPSAKEVALLAYDRLQAGQLEDVAYFEPFYLKDFVAGKPKKLV